MVNYDLPSDSSVSVTTEEDSTHIRSTLTISNAQPEDAGNYTCQPSNAIAASIQVFVSEGKQIFVLILDRKTRTSLILLIFRSEIRAFAKARCSQRPSDRR